MKIEHTTYYKRVTAPLRSNSAVTFGEEGFSYKGTALYFVVLRTSKNVYKIAVTYRNELNIISREGFDEIVSDALALIELDCVL